MKKLSFFCLLLISSMALAQSPNALSYQAVVRNSSNELVKNQNVSSRFSILKGSVSGTVVYSESQIQATNTNGLLTSRIGTGTIITGSFANIDWGSDNYFVKTETDPNGGTNYAIVGTTQLLSVPYALYAKSSGSSTPGPQGIPGIQGPKGDTGAQGVKGDQGIQGVKGDTGAQGLKGDQGLQGIKGDTGAQGLQGIKGDIGAQGLQGVKGDTGAQGLQGIKGDTGAQGLQGIKGDTGAQGIQGVKGDTGAQGLQGVKGDQGIQGVKGDTGPQGVAGAVGAGFANGSASAQVYLTGSSSPYAPQAPVSVNGDVTINTSGSTAIGASKVTTDKINDGAVTVAKLSATGTKDSTTFLRGDGTWTTPSGGGSASGLAMVTVNGNTTLNNVNQMIYITGLYTVTLPANPSTGLMIYISTENKNAILDPGTKKFRQNGQDYPASKISDFGKDATTNGNSIGMILIYNGSKWFSY